MTARITAHDRPPNLLLQMLDREEFELLQPYLVTTEMVRETVLSKQGHRAAHVYFPHGGAVSITVTLAEGQTIEVAMLGRDSLVGAGGALAGGIALTDAIVLFPGAASMLSLAAFRSIANGSAAGFLRLVVRHEQALLLHAQQSLVCNTLHPLEARLARCLLRARDLCDTESLPLTQEHLAQMIGVRRNAISIVASALQRAGAIRYSRGQIDITDREALARTSCDCYFAVKAQRELLLSTGR
jgi:CRP-like cAMP-binding protein